MRPHKHFSTRHKRIGVLRLARSQTTVHIRIGEKILAAVSGGACPQTRDWNQRFPAYSEKARLRGPVRIESREENLRIRNKVRTAIRIIGQCIRRANQERCSYVMNASQAPTVKGVVPDPVWGLPERFCEQHLFKKNQ